MWENFKNFWIDLARRLARALNLYTSYQHDAACDAITKLYEAQIAELKSVYGQERITLLKEISEAKVSIKAKDSAIAEKDSLIAELESQVADLRAVVEPVQEKNRQLQIECDKANNAAKENLDYIKELLKQIGDGFHEDRDFSFPHSRAIPGSICVRSVKERDNSTNDEIVTIGRMIMTDDITAKLNEIPDLNTRLGIAIGQIQAYGTADRIVSEMIRSGAIDFSLVYNGNCTSFELFYRILSKRPTEGSFGFKQFEGEIPDAVSLLYEKKDENGEWVICR